MGHRNWIYENEFLQKQNEKPEEDQEEEPESDGDEITSQGENNEGAAHASAESPTMPSEAQASKAATAQPAKAAAIAAQILKGEKRDLQFGPYKWRVLEVKGDRALMITEDVVEERAYHGEKVPVTWAACDLRKYLNGEFLQKFADRERKQIVKTTISNPDRPTFMTPGGPDTKDKVFLLTIDEAGKYLDQKGREAKCDWWLRTPGYNSTEASVVQDNQGTLRGFLSICTWVNYPVGVRPALWLNLKP
jgi:hypothetical protein